MSIMALLIVVELLVLYFTINTLSATRAYVACEGYYSGAQKSAVYSLKKYLGTHDEKDFKSFLTSLDVPEGDHQARLELEKKSPDQSIIYWGMLQGRNHPDDIEKMVSLFRRFRNVRYIDKAIGIWAQADDKIEMLRNRGYDLHREMLSGKPSNAVINLRSAEIDQLNSELTVLEDRFSYTLGEGSRWLEELLFKMLFFIALTVEFTGIMLTVAIGMGITRGINNISAVAEKIAKGDFSERAKIRSKDEIGQLAQAFNHMADDLVKRREEQQVINEKLAMQALQLADAQQVARTGSWELDMVSNRLSLSDELIKIYGVAREKSITTVEDFIKFIAPEDRDKVKKIIESSAADPQPLEFKYRIIRADQSVRVLHARVEVLRTDDGKPVKMRGTGQDITEKEHEQELEKLMLAATQSFNSVIIANKKGDIEWVNEGFEKLTGYTIEDVRNTHGEVLRGGEETSLSPNSPILQSILNEKKPVTYETKNFTKEGKEFWVITTLTPVVGKDGEVQRIIAIDSDITLRKHIEEELMEANKKAEDSIRKGDKAISELIRAKQQLEESMSVKEQFLANMSHEIRTPMNAIVGFTDVILKTELNPEQKQYVDAIKTSGENLLVIINDILDFSKLQSGKFVFEQIEMRISEVISMLLEVMLHKSIEKGIKLIPRIDQRIPDKLIGDPTRLNQVLLNLVGNAIKFTEKGEVRILVELVDQSDTEVELRFSVVDTGIGIPHEKLSTIFEGFTQASNETSRKYGGTGLGLSIARQLVELQNGKIHVESEPGVGSSFSFSLKYRKPDPSKAPRKAEPEEDYKNNHLEGLRILLVEDNEFNQILAKKVLSDWKWEVDIAENGLIALQKVEEKDYDVILMDIQLPEMDGYEAAGRIRKGFPAPKSQTPIIAMTAHALAGEAEKCYKAGINEYISKPFNRKVLYNKIMAVMHSKKIFDDGNSTETH